MANITLVPLAPDDRNQFILDNQEAFNYGALEEFGLRDDHFEEEGRIRALDCGFFRKVSGSRENLKSKGRNNEYVG